MKESNSCGKCCIKYGDGGLSASPSEIDWWEIFRPEIYQYVNKGQLWIDPASGKQLTRCPWLQKPAGQTTYSCSIYHDRPDECRHYPTTIAEMVKDSCEMLEVQDLKNPSRAQKMLDRLMIDSRPALQ